MTRSIRTPFAMLAVLYFCTFAGTPALRAEDPPLPKKVVTIEGITEYKLDNGLRLLLFPDQASSKVTVNMTVLVGSRHEGYGETGMAHLLEHMVFKGTPTHRDVPKALKDHGANFNGSTSDDRTNYFETMNATDENLEFGIRLEADRLVNSFVKREDLVSEMTVVRNEFERGEDNPIGILMQRMAAAAYEWHNYGKSTIGNRSDIERVPIEKLQAFYRKYYQPDNIVLVIAGKFEEKKALSLVAKYFGALKRPERKLDDTYTEEPSQDGERIAILRRVGTVGVVGAVYHIPASSHKDFAAIEVLANVLSAQPNGRLYKRLVETKKAPQTFASAFGKHDPGLMVVLVQAEKGQPLESVRDAMTDIVEKIDSEPFTQEDVDRAKGKMANSFERQMADPNRVGVGLSEWAAKGDWRLFFLHRDRVAEVTPADVTRVAKTYLKRNNRTVGMFIPSTAPERAAIPPTPDIAELVKDYKGTETIAKGEFFDPTVENILGRVKQQKLASGVQAAFMEKKTRGEIVNLSMKLRFGNPESLKGLTTTAEFLGALMDRGTKTMNRQQIEDKLQKLKATLSISSGVGDLNVSIRCKRDNLPGVLAILKDILREPSFPEDEFNVIKRQSIDSLERSKTEPGSLGSRALQRALNPRDKDDVRYSPTIAEEIDRIKAVTLDDVKKLYAEQLGGEVGQVAVVGDFDPKATVAGLETALNGWKSKVPYHRIKEPAITTVKGERITIETPDKANANYYAGLMLAMTDDDPDHAALEIANFIFGGGTLSSRLGNRVRQKEGLSYGVRSSYFADALDRSAGFTMTASTKPTNRAKVDSAIADELAKMIKDGITETELSEAKKAFLAERKNSRGSDGVLAGQLLRQLEAGRTFAYYGDLEKRIEALTVAQVNEAFRKHIDPKRLVIVEAGDFTKNAGSEK